LYTIIPATWAESGEGEMVLVRDNRGGRNPLLVLNISSAELLLGEVVLMPTWPKQVTKNSHDTDSKNDLFI
jgi:hypothetical protein